MIRSCLSLLVSTALILGATAAHAQRGVLLAADDPKQIAQVDLAQVMAGDSTHWLSVRLKAQTRLALVSATGTTEMEATKSADLWLRALDFATRERIAAPPGPLAACPERAAFPFADSGLPELAPVAAQPATTADSDVELERALTNAGIAVDAASVSAFTADNAGPYQITVFDAPSKGGATAALRWLDHDAQGELPVFYLAGLNSVPVSLIALGADAVQSKAGGDADPSEFPVTYFALGATSDYVTARASWQHDNADRWLVEAANTSALFDVTVFGGEQQVPSVLSRYLSPDLGGTASDCEAQLKAARARGSKTPADFTCGGAEDLAQALSELDFADLRLTRLFGSTSAARAFVVHAGAQQNPRLQATDFETKGCSTPNGAGQGSGMSTANGNGSGNAMGTGTGTTTGTGQTSGSNRSGSESSTEVNTSTSVDQSSSTDNGGCGVWVDTSSSSDSCSGDSSSSDSSSNDSCSGDSSSSDSSSSDSCSGNSSSSDSSSDDSCSGNTDSTSNDASGCGSNDKSGYDGDTCTGNSASSTSQGLSAPQPSRPHHVRLSLITLLAAGLSLPLRRRVK